MMSTPRRILFTLMLGVLSLAACAPEVGSERWCASMDEKPGGDWTANEAGDYARHCLIN